MMTPVRGFFVCRALRDRVEKLPNPLISTRRPSRKASLIDANIISTAVVRSCFPTGRFSLIASTRSFFSTLTVTTLALPQIRRYKYILSGSPPPLFFWFGVAFRRRLEQVAKGCRGRLGDFRLFFLDLFHGSRLTLVFKRLYGKADLAILG